MRRDERVNLAPGALTAPLPPVIVSVGDLDNANLITIGWTGILATVPPKTYISVRPTRHSYGMLKEGGEFVINLPSVSMARAVDYIGIYTGKKVDKFKKCALTKKKSEKVAPPTVAECPIALECRVTEVIPMGSHDVFIADIVGVSCHADIIDAEGKMHFERADLLAYAHGEYYALGERVGRFGFSTDKPEKREAAPKKSETEKKESRSEKVNAKTAKSNEPRPFYLDAPHSKSAKKKKPSDKDKGKRRGGSKR